MPLDALITGRIATLEGDAGFGWVEAIGIRDGRIAFAGLRGLPRDPGRPVHGAHPPRAGPGRDPRADRRAPAPGAGRAWRRARSTSTTPRRSTTGSLACARRTSALPRRRLARGPRLGLATGGAAGRRPTRWKRSRPAVEAALWAHDHHALWASHAALAHGRSCRCRRPAGRRRPARGRRDARGRAVRGGHPARHDPRAAAVDRRPRSARSSRSGRTWSRSASSPATTRAASRRIRTCPTRSRRTLGCPTRAGCRCASMPACATTRSRPRSSRAIGAATSLGADPDGRATRRLAEVLRRRLARVADGRPPRGHRAGARPTAPARPPPRRLDDRSGRLSRSASRGRPPAASRRTIHAIGDAAVRAALDVLTPFARDVARSCPASSTSRCSIRTTGRVSRPPASPPASSPSISGRTRLQAREAVGRPRRGRGLHLEGHRRHRRGHGIRDRRAGRVVRPVAGSRAGGAPRGPALAGGHAGVRAGRRR